MAARSCAPFSFHCVICFEAFDADDRPPVVLPCGHTYICAPCSKRLKRCMECRTELFLTPPPSRASQQQQAARNRSNASRYAAEPLRPPPSLAEPIALPLPKNLVMMTLMEASIRTEKAKKLAAAAAAARNRMCSEIVNVCLDTDDDDAYASGDDDEKVLTGISAMTSLCGTYAVRDPEGLVILPDNPNKSLEKTGSVFPVAMLHSPTKKSLQSLHEIFKQPCSPSDNRVAPMLSQEQCYCRPLPSLPEGAAIDMPVLANTELDDREELTIVSRSSEDNETAKSPMHSGFYKNLRDNPPYEHSFSIAPRLKATTLGHEEVIGITEQIPPHSTILKDEQAEAMVPSFRRPIKLEFGQKVQIVDFKGGVAKLARGVGYIIASSAQLVKVGGPFDNACYIEGTISSLESTKANLLKKLQDIERTEAELHRDLDEALSMTPAYPLTQPLSHPSDPKITDPTNHLSFITTQDTSSPVTVQSQGAEGISSPRSASPVSPPLLVGRGNCASMRHVGFSISIDDSPLIDYDRQNAVQLSDADRVSLRTPHVSILESNDIDYSTGSRLICGSSFLSDCEHDENETFVEGSIEMNYKESPPSRSMPLFQMEKVRSENSLRVERVYMDMIDFRTGLSGHLALTSTRSHADRRTQSTTRAVRMMSEHKGIASIRPVRQLNTYGPSTLTKSPKRLASKKTW